MVKDLRDKDTSTDTRRLKRHSINVKYVCGVTFKLISNLKIITKAITEH